MPSGQGMKGKQQFLRYAILLVILGVVYWQRDRIPSDPTRPTPPPVEEPQPEAGPVTPSAPEKNVKPSSSPSAVKASKQGVYDRFADARLLERDGNDGDSFWVTAGGREFELRLYFVDAPESYLSDRYADQRRRVAEQARELGGITPEEAVEVGKRAKAFTKQQLANRSFTVYTYWEQVFDGDRFYGFVELPDGSDLATRLVEQGLGRIHTKGPGSKAKPVPTPQGQSFFQARDRLEAIERQARKEKRGAWGY
ncbi:MAG: thermonuclease family protein [Verrucomicrobiae bacterium]|nr:thermonuclease family protein [Verrucomicrobiae bacterium]